MSGEVRTRVVVQKTSRECRLLCCNCHVFNKSLRALSALTNLGIGVAAGYIVYIGHQVYTYQALNSCFWVENSRMAVFYGLIGVCYMMFGILGFLAELRFERLRNTVLWPFAFMLRYIGRGVTYMLLGAIFCSIPMRKSDEVVTLVPGAVLIACGIAQLIIGTCVTKEAHVRVRTEPSFDSGASAPAVAEAAPATPSKVRLVSNDSAAAAAAAASPSVKPSSTVVTANPFRNAGSK